MRNACSLKPYVRRAPILDASTNARNVYAYSAYGEVAVLGPDGGNALQYTGRENDGAGLYYFRARYYDTLTKRWISGDPIGLGGGINLYAYVAGRPTRYNDAAGLAPGEKFFSEPAAAYDAHNYIGNTFPDSKQYEYSSTIYRDGSGAFSYTPPRTDRDPVQVSPAPAPPGTTGTADYHNHIPLPPNNIVQRPDGSRVRVDPSKHYDPSDKDQDYSDATGWRGYVGFPDGRIVVVRPNPYSDKFWERNRQTTFDGPCP